MVSVEQRVTEALLGYSDSLQYFATLSPFVSLLRQFCLFFFICSFSSSFPPQTGQRTPLSLPWWIDESEINCTGLLKEATCASWSRIGFTVSAHSGLFLAQPFKPGRPSFGLLKLKHVVIIYTNITIQNMLACYKTWGVLLHCALDISSPVVSALPANKSCSQLKVRSGCKVMSMVQMSNVNCIGLLWWSRRLWALRVPHWVRSLGWPLKSKKQKTAHAYTFAANSFCEVVFPHDNQVLQFIVCQWRKTLFISVRQLQHGKENVSAAYKWLSSKVNAMNIGLSLKCNSDASWPHKHEPVPGEVNTVIQMHSNQSACDKITNSALEKSGPLWQCSFWKPHSFLPCHWTLENSSYIFNLCLQKYFLFIMGCDS